MTIDELIEKLKALPGDTTIRPIVVEVVDDFLLVHRRHVVAVELDKTSIVLRS